MKPRFITLEGGEGVGKSTQLQRIKACLETAGASVVTTREPGGTRLGERLREVLLEENEELTPIPMAELLLMFAARAHHVATVIAPALQRGDWVLCDRFSDASFAYQGFGRGLGADAVQTLEKLAHPNLSPDLTILLDVDPAVGLARARERGDLDRFEVETSDFFARVREGYLQRAAMAPERWRIIDASQSIAAVGDDIECALNAWLGGASDL